VKLFQLIEWPAGNMGHLILSNMPEKKKPFLQEADSSDMKLLSIIPNYFEQLQQLVLRTRHDFALIYQVPLSTLLSSLGTKLGGVNKILSSHDP
jgi:hypothetical protein